ncbi:MAG: ankyrin repeat domain-containing protein [Sulfuricurvum sp.]|uniref:ankyrin repeat domain-containing protein n=1 Tax=Sulfuricurvum sp. TaxID=2025608 RepID=UPI00262608A3|nr:ankyrin repeat domain-containing protein [Sulfuricurvum sp.]MDD2370068.1 ankyrin repeat domain-containing protein [Sulfuricurvum sp.]MDD2951237.1 ankyrin repeat domain-containing protein [Sulfuricurvum sp.]MDD5118087.1 ankyrin repeat domain-containing protein [Sulfuricurvum sp.]
MKKKILIAFFLMTNCLYGADILTLVSLLDRNDTATFESQVQSIQDANTAREDNNKTILMYACWVGNIDAVKYLVEKGADVSVQDSGGATALHLAIWKGYTPIALYLLEKGASGRVMSKDGMTPLDIAEMRGNKEVSSAIEKATPKLKPLL